jgi:peptide-methionine (S)-S-oxide reductase
MNHPLKYARQPAPDATHPGKDAARSLADPLRGKGSLMDQGTATIMRKKLQAALLAVAAMTLGGLALQGAEASEKAYVIPAPASDLAPGPVMKATAVFAGGCFWGVQGVFQHVEGVLSATSGYAGGEMATAVYETVGSGRTGHAEAVEIVYDPGKVSYGQLLQIFFSVTHNPTQLNRQGPDVGPQYRSAIFPADAQQARVAQAYIAQLEDTKIFGAPIVTKIEPDKNFYAAEDYHQDFLTNNPTYPYIVFNDLPKIENLKQLFPKEYRVTPVLVGVGRKIN